MNSLAMNNMDGGYTCPICYETGSLEDDNRNLIKLNCNHVFHKSCFFESIRDKFPDYKRCPICRTQYENYTDVLEDHTLYEPVRDEHEELTEEEFEDLQMRTKRARIVKGENRGRDRIMKEEEYNLPATIIFCEKINLDSDGIVYAYSSDKKIPLSAIKKLTFSSGFKTNLTELNLKNIEIREIPDNFLARNENLISLTLPNTLSQVGNTFLYYCDGLRSLTLPNTLSQVGDSFLNGYRGLTSLELPNTLSQVGNDFLQDCTGLTSLSLPNNLSQVGNYFLYNCSRLTSLIITREQSNMIYIKDFLRKQNIIPTIKI